MHHSRSLPSLPPHTPPIPPPVTDMKCVVSRPSHLHPSPFAAYAEAMSRRKEKDKERKTKSGAKPQVPKTKTPVPEPARRPSPSPSPVPLVPLPPGAEVGHNVAPAETGIAQSAPEEMTSEHLKQANASVRESAAAVVHPLSVVPSLATEASGAESVTSDAALLETEPAKGAEAGPSGPKKRDKRAKSLVPTAGPKGVAADLFKH